MKCMPKKQWDDEADIVIIGSGGAAAASAISVYESGIRKILILEKAPFTGGASAISGGAMSASHSKFNLQKKPASRIQKRFITKIH